MIRKIPSILTWVISLTLLAGAIGLLIVATPLFGNKALIVRSGSMEPSISVGDLVIVRSQTETYDVGQVISYKLPDHQNMVVTHRITDASSGVYRTKGDANNEEDSYTIQPDQILGRQLLTVPYIGKLLAFAKTKVGFVSLVVIPALAVIIGEAFVIVRELHRKKYQPDITPQPAPSRVFAVPPAETDLEYRPPYREAEPWPNELAHLFNATTQHMRPVMDSLSRRLVMFLAALAMVSTSTWALYSDTATSTNNIFAAAEDFGGPSPTPTPSVTPSPTPTPTPGPAASVVINEIMWMGSTNNTADEWIELRNLTADPVDVTDWQVINGGAGASHIILSGTIPGNGFFLISNFIPSNPQSDLNDSLTVDAQANVSLLNDGEQLTLQDASATIIDRTPVPPPAWAAGVNTTLKQSMSRNDPPSDGTVGGNWHTCTNASCNDTTYWDTEANNYGTPKATNL